LTDTWQISAPTSPPPNRDSGWAITPPAPSHPGWDPHAAWDEFHRLQYNIGLGGVEVARDIVNTLITPKEMGKPDVADHYLMGLRDWLDERVKMTPAPPPTTDPVHGVLTPAEQAVGGLPLGALEWALDWPFAAAHGIHTATDHAEEQGKKASLGAMAWDAVVEGGGRKIMGIVAARPMGRLQQGMAFGGISGVEDIAEKKDRQQQAFDFGINFLIGALGPNITRADAVEIQKAREAHLRGDDKGAMAHLNPVLEKHSTTIATAARNLGVDVGVEPQPPTGAHPPVPKTHVRLYRGETEAGPHTTFHTTEEAARDYNMTHGDKTGRVTYVDVPKAAAKSYRVKPPETAELPLEVEHAEDPALTQAREDVALHRSKEDKGKSLYQEIKELGGIKHTDEAGTRTPEGGEAVQAIGGRKYPGLLNRNGHTPDAIRQMLQDRGWFGHVDQRQGADTRGARGESLDELYDLLRRNPSRGGDAEARRRIDEDLTRAGVTGEHSHEEAAQMLSEYRRTEAANLDDLRSIADTFGVSHEEGMGYDQVLGDVINHLSPEDLDALDRLYQAEITGTEESPAPRTEASGGGEGAGGGGGGEPPPDEPLDEGSHKLPPEIADLRKALPERERAEGLPAKQTAAISLATRLTHQERMAAVHRARIAGWEEQWAGVSDMDRIQALTAYQRGGVEAVPDQWKGFFQGFSDVMREQYDAEQAAGITYDLRENYAAGYWQDERGAQQYYSANPKAPGNVFTKPGFTRPKGFEDYAEGIAAGFKPKTTNPAVIAAMRLEAGEAAITRRLAMRDLVEDGLAAPAVEANAEGAETAKEKATRVVDYHLQRMLSDGRAREVSELNADRKAEGLPPVRGNFRHGGTEYEVLPDALQMLKKRREQIMAVKGRPQTYDGWGNVTIGGTAYLVHPDALRLLNRAFNLDRQQLTDFLGIDRMSALARGERGLYNAWMGTRNASIPIALSISAFHAMHILGIDLAQPITAATTESLNRRMTVRDFAKALMDENAKGRDEYGALLSHNFSEEMENLSPLERAEQNLMLAGGFSAQEPSIYEVRARQSYRRQVNDIIPSIKQQAEREGWSNIATRMKLAPEELKAIVMKGGSVIEAMEGPLFQTFIPRLKSAAYLNQAKLTLAARPELLAGTPEANANLRAAMREIAESIDNRYGQMQYNKLFWPSIVRRGVFAFALSAGWNLGFLREFGRGIFYDLPKTAISMMPGREREELSTRTIYASTYLFIGTVVAGMMTYLMTGEPPKEPKDFIYPKMADGSRLNTMFFNREFAAAYYHITQEGLVKGTGNLLQNKLNGLADSMFEAMHNEDYYGNQIYDPNAPIWQQVAQAIEHQSLGLVTPFSIRGIAAHPTESPAQFALGVAGFQPAAKYIELTAGQALIKRRFEEEHPNAPIAYQEEKRVNALRSIKHTYQDWLKTGDDATHDRFESLLDQYEQQFPTYLRRGRLRHEIKQWSVPEYASYFQQIDRDSQRHVLRVMDPDERAAYLPYANPAVREEFSAEVHQ
jgi:hypothetical protein